MVGMLDVVTSRVDLPLPDVIVLDVGLSDHRLLCWSAPLSWQTPVYTIATCRPWSRLDPAEFTAALQSSLLNHPDIWTDLNVDDLARLYDSEITSILDRTVPVRTVQYRRRPSDPWFDGECRMEKRRVRSLERECRKADPSRAAAATAAWMARHRAYRDLLRLKRESFWTAKVDSEKSRPYLL